MAVIHTTGPDNASQEFTNNKRLLIDAVDRTLGRKVQSATISRNQQFFNSSGLSADDMDEPERAYNARSTMQVLEQVADWFGSVRGRRKAILFMSEGVDYDLNDIIGSPNQPTSWSAGVYDQVLDTIAAAARSNVAIYGIDPRGLTNLGDDDITVSSYAGDAGVSSGASSDPSNSPPIADGSGIGRGSMQAELRSAQDSLRQLSEETGGFAVVNSNQFPTAFARLVADNSSYYVLAYYPPSTKRDGKFHRIDVKVNRPGLTVRARKGYVSPKGKPAAPPPADPK
jgi:VWFA-related protein